MGELCVNLAMAEDGYFVIFVKGKKPMSKLKTIGSTVDVRLAELLDISCVQSAKFSNVSLSQITLMVRTYPFETLNSSGFLAMI